jgi:DNA-binding CsgD family transcriptional regulator
MAPALALPPALQFSLFALALLSAPSSFILLFLAHDRSGELSLRSLGLCLLGLLFVLAGDGTNLALARLSGLRDPRIDYLILLEVSLASVMMAGFLATFAFQCSRVKFVSGARVVFWALSTAAFFLAASLPAFASGSIGHRLELGYSAVTLYIASIQVCSTFVILRHRGSLPGPYRNYLPWINSGLLLVGLACAANGAAHVLGLKGGGDFMFSPLFFCLFSASVNVLCLRFLREGPGKAPTRLPDLDLSSREREIAQLIVEGLTNEEIGNRLFISPHTVKNHVTSLFRKAGVAGRPALARLWAGGPASGAAPGAAVASREIPGKGFLPDSYTDRESKGKIGS